MRKHRFRAYLDCKKGGTMRRIVITFGLIAGAIVVLLGGLNITLLKSGTVDFDNSETVGYTSMIIALSMVFFGIKSFRDKEQRGAIKFGKGVQVGLLIILIASSLYVAAWEVYYQTNEEIRNSFMDRYTEHTLNKMKEKGSSDAEIEETRTTMKGLSESYKNPFFRIALTYAEIVPVGILVTLISAGILRKKEILPPTG